MFSAIGIFKHTNYQLLTRLWSCPTLWAGSAETRDNMVTSITFWGMGRALQEQGGKGGGLSILGRQRVPPKRPLTI